MSMETLVLAPLRCPEDDVEVVERKGLGHPDTICDALAETLSASLCREYVRRFGRCLHYNVDKALLVGGQAAPAFGGGTVLAPIQIYLAGRAVGTVGNEVIPIRDLAIEGSRAWLRSHLHALDAERHVQIHELVQPGSQDLQELFSRGAPAQVPLANDSSIGVGYAPLSRLEQLVLAAEPRIRGQDRGGPHPARGEDVKVLGIRRGNAVELTAACAMVGGSLRHLDDYLAEKAAVADALRELAAQFGFPDSRIAVNAADHPASGSVYLTVTGTSAEAGDDGQVGRGNRVNGLIAPGRPMSLEAAAGKNPLTHAGKIYNVLARDIAAALVAAVPDIAAAQCLLVSRIGSPVTRPALVRISLATRDGMPLEPLRDRVEEIAASFLDRAPSLIDAFAEGTIGLF